MSIGCVNYNWNCQSRCAPCRLSVARKRATKRTAFGYFKFRMKIHFSRKSFLRRTYYRYANNYFFKKISGMFPTIQRNKHLQMIKFKTESVNNCNTFCVLLHLFSQISQLLFNIFIKLVAFSVVPTLSLAICDLVRE